MDTEGSDTEYTTDLTNVDDDDTSEYGCRSDEEKVATYVDELDLSDIEEDRDYSHEWRHHYVVHPLLPFQIKGAPRGAT